MKEVQNRYRFILFSLGKLDLGEITAYSVDAKILKQKYSYCYFFVSKDELNQYLKANIDNQQVHIDTFSSIGRRLKTDSIVLLYNSTIDTLLKQQLYELIDARNTVIKTQEKLKLKGVEFAKVFSVRPSDVNIWRNMITKPDSFKLEVMKYILLSKDIQKNSFIKYLMAKADKHYTVTITNLKTKKSIELYTKKFDNKLDAIEYFEKLKNDHQFLDLNLEIKILDYFDEIVEKILS
ncbi:hypothetical protein [Francisella tularensis]|uniref:hypothetical protein n=1 Tax=Francisella tularensis TaxID=263 RepID=UPI001C0EDB55|nr:hypothetical protein [Francisella tularensis]MBK2110170.1 hypothetical protein [Francisella tularensis subsp. novicida FSC595]